MNKTYKSVKSSIVEALNHIEAFEEKMDKFSEKHPKYKHSINLTETEQKEWCTEIQIKTEDEKFTKELS